MAVNYFFIYPIQYAGRKGAIPPPPPPGESTTKKPTPLLLL